MRYFFNLKSFICTFGSLLLFTITLNSQTYSYRNYGIESDIPDGFVYTINQSVDGFLWVGTGNGMSKFDGFNFHITEYPDSISGRYPVTSLTDSNGILWFGCNDGSLFFVSEESLVQVPLSNTRSISDIIEGPDGIIYIIPQGGAIFFVDPDDPVAAGQYTFSANAVMFSGSFTSSGDLLISTQENVLRCRLEDESVSVINTIEGFDYAAVSAIHKIEEDDLFILGTEGNGLFRLQLTDGDYSLDRFVDNPDWEYLDVQAITEDRNNNIWISTFGDGVIQLSSADYFVTVGKIRLFNIESGLPSNDVTSVFEDLEGNYWIGLFGAGISLLESYAFSFYIPGNDPVNNNILYINSYDDNYFLGTPEGFHLFDPDRGESLSFTDLSAKVGMAEIVSYYIDSDNTLWIGTAGNGLYMMNGSGTVRPFYRTGDYGIDYIKDIEKTGHSLWLATTNGLIVIDSDSGEEKGRFDMDNGLVHNFINGIFIGSDRQVYVGIESDRLYRIDPDLNITVGENIMTGSTLNEILSFTEDRDGVIWVATKGNGLFRIDRDTISGISRSNDLMSNYCYSVLADSEGYIWAGHDKGFSRYDPEKGIMKVFGTEFTREGLCTLGGMFESEDGKIFIGTTEGLVMYDRLLDNKRILPPLNNINYITINEVRYPYRPSFSLPYNRNYRVRINYVGINFSDPEKVYYSTFMENYDDDWSQLTTERELPYGLNDGRYRFNMISVNEAGLSQEEPISFEITIKAPFWRRWWFVLSTIVIVVGIVILIIRQREKAQKKIQEYLERELEARTSVVMKQKGEIELQNIEITDSINYAKRIQSSILPDIGKLKESFRDAFIIFHPRDIVSGDFFWFDKLDDDTFIIVCADSTGHGVPGAFMSMIGSTLLQDIVARKRISKPSEILTLLDEQIFSTLNQNIELGVSNDGMDMVVCEFNIKTRYIRFASAMRPVILIMDNELYYIKGNRSSVGGEAVIEKYFDDQEYYLNEGDIVYLFSDGLPDQFGGVDGKKMKIARLKQLLEKVSKQSMNDQKEKISEYFSEWKGDYEQVDDILLMGIKV